MRIIEPKTAVAFELRCGNTLRVVDVDGGQCADVVAFDATNLSEHLSQNCTRVNNWKLGVSMGDKLYSNRNSEMFEVVGDTLGQHDLLFPTCSRFVYETLFEGPSQDGCAELLQAALDPWGIHRDVVTDPLNVFMNIAIDASGLISIKSARSRPGESVELRAEKACIVAVSACPDDRSPCNNHRCTRIGVEVS